MIRLMIRRRVIAAALVLASMQSHAGTYTLEPDYTQGVVRWNHLGFSNPAAQFSQGQGTLEFDPADPAMSSVKVTIPLATLNTGVPALDEHLRSEDFFESARFPTVTFTSTGVAKTAANRLTVKGDLSLHGVVKPVTLAVTIVKIGLNPRTNLPTVGFDATTTLKRSDFGLGRFVPQVSDEVQLHIISQAVDAKGYAEYQKAEAAAVPRRVARSRGADRVLLCGGVVEHLFLHIDVARQERPTLHPPASVAVDRSGSISLVSNCETSLHKSSMRRRRPEALVATERRRDSGGSMVTMLGHFRGSAATPDSEVDAVRRGALR